MPEVATRKPRRSELDVYGLTHQGKVRSSNQDHFLLASLDRKLDVIATSLPVEQLPQPDERIAFIAMIADGVGGRENGEEASRLALEEATDYLTQCTDCYYQGDAGAETFVVTLQEAAIRCHTRVVEHAKAHPDHRGMATTLTMCIGVWPWIYLLQVGDSRYYRFVDDTLHQVTRDQTMAQELIDQGVMTRSVALASRWANVLSSSIGGEQTAPVVTRLPSNWGDIHLICSDGLTKHVSDERIAEHLRGMRTAHETCEALLQDALDAGGSDNISIIIARAIRRPTA
jgi:protein phosphatase